LIQIKFAAFQYEAYYSLRIRRGQTRWKSRPNGSKRIKIWLGRWILRYLFWHHLFRNVPSTIPWWMRPQIQRTARKIFIT